MQINGQVFCLKENKMVGKEADKESVPPAVGNLPELLLLIITFFGTNLIYLGILQF